MTEPELGTPRPAATARADSAPRARVVVVVDTRRRDARRRPTSFLVLVRALVMAKTRRRKRRTHVDADAGPRGGATDVPRTFVFRRGRMADAVKDLSDDVRKVRARVVVEVLVSCRRRRRRLGVNASTDGGARAGDGAAHGEKFKRVEE